MTAPIRLVKDKYFADKCADEALVFKNRAQNWRIVQNNKVQKTYMSTKTVAGKRFLC